MKALVTTNYVVDNEFGVAQLDNFEEIDIPEGCSLAVVDTNKGIGFQEEADYILLIQVVKL